MAVFRVEHNKNYTHMANYHFKDKGLSWKAKGILSNMLSLPDTWDYSLAGLATLASDGLSATRTALKELEEHGYLIRRPIRENGKIRDWEYLIFEKPQLEKPVVENLNVENQMQLNTNQSNTNQSSTKKSNTKDKDIVEIVSYLNEKAGMNYRSTTKGTQKLIKARFADGFTIEDFKIVIDKKCTDWKGTEWEKYLRPETLFGNKFEGYLNAKSTTKKQKEENGEDYGSPMDFYS